MASPWKSAEQYNPVSSTEVAALDGLDVRALVDSGRGVNNAHDYVFAFKPVIAIGLTLCQSPAVGVTDEYLVAYLGRHKIPDGYTKLRFWTNTIRIAGADSVIWRIIVGTGGLYRGDEVFDITQVRTPFYSSAETDSDSKVIETGTVSIITLQNRDVWMYLTAQNQDSSTQATMLSLDLQYEV